MSLVVVNVNDQRDYEVEVGGVGANIAVYTVTGPSVKAVNAAGKEEVGIKETKWDGIGKFKFSRHSMTMLRWQTGQKVVEVSKGDGLRLDTRKLAWS